MGFEEILPTDLNKATIEIDLRRFDWIYAHGGCALYLLLKYRIAQGKKTKVLLPSDSNLISYMERMNIFYDTCEEIEFVPTVSEYKKHSWYETAGMQELTQLKDRKHVPILVDKLVGVIRELGKFDGDQSQGFHSCLLELIQNIPDHAEPDDPDKFIGYINFQTYQRNDRKDRMYISIGDLGVGIRKSLRQRDDFMVAKWTVNDINAIKHVMTEKTSRFKDKYHSRGGGIHSATQSIQGLGGYIMIRSGRGSVSRSPDGTFSIRSNLKFFPGTQIVILTTRS